MNWYLSKIVFRILCGNGDHTAQFDEQLRLVAARDEKEAYHKSVELGTKEQEVFYNQNQQLVQWQFVNVSELYRVSELIDGAELYSRITEVDDADSYSKLVNMKAASIREPYISKTLQLV